MTIEDLPNLVITKVHWANRMYTEKNASNSRCERKCRGLILKAVGMTEYLCGGKKYISTPNDIMLLPAGSSYSWKCIEAGEFIAVDFEADGLNEEIFSFHIKNNSDTLRIFKELEQNHRLKPFLGEMKNINGVYQILIKILKTTKPKYEYLSKYNKIKKSIDFINENYTKKITNDEIAAYSGISTIYFIKIFTEIYGIAPINYVHKRRIEKAQELLMSDYSSIENIALSLGYGSIYHFSKMFKKHTGVSPSIFLKSKR